MWPAITGELWWRESLSACQRIDSLSLSTRLVMRDHYYPYQPVSFDRASFVASYQWQILNHPQSHINLYYQPSLTITKHYSSPPLIQKTTIFNRILHHQPPLWTHSKPWYSTSRGEFPALRADRSCWQRFKAPVYTVESLSFATQVK